MNEIFILALANRVKEDESLLDNLSEDVRVLVEKKVVELQTQKQDE